MINSDCRKYFTPQPAFENLFQKTSSDTEKRKVVPIVLGVQHSVDTGAVKDISYEFDVSKWVCDTCDDETSDQCKLMMQKLDDVITIRREQPNHGEIYSQLEAIADNVCTELPKLQANLEKVLAIPTGSAYSDVKVGLPYELDFLLQIQLRSDNPSDFTMATFYALMSELREKQLILNEQHKGWTLHGIQEHRVGACLVLTYDDEASSQRLGVTIDLVPAYRVTEKDLERFSLREETLTYLSHHCSLERTGKSDVYTLVSAIRDSTFDTGVLKNDILASMSAEQKRGFRVAKYLLQNGVCFDDAQYSKLLPRDVSLTLYGCRPVLKSFYVRICFLHLLLQLHKHDVTPQQLGGFRLALCVLDMFQTVFQTIHDEKIKDPSLMLSFVDPVIKDEHLQYKLMWAASRCQYFAMRIKRVTDAFLRYSKTCDISRYKLYNYPALEA